MGNIKPKEFTDPQTRPCQSDDGCAQVAHPHLDGAHLSQRQRINLPLVTLWQLDPMAGRRRDHAVVNAQASAWYVFGDLAANVDLVRLCEAVDKAKGHSLTRTQITSAVFSNSKSAAAISELIRQAVATGGYETTTESGKPGRPAMRLTKVTKNPPDTPAGGHEVNEVDEETPVVDRVTSSHSFTSSTPDDDGGGSSSSPDNQICPACGGFKNWWRRACPDCEDLPRETGPAPRHQTSLPRAKLAQHSLRQDAIGQLP
jgi:hypothetical protein